MSQETAYLVLIAGALMNAYSTYPLIRSELQYREGCLHALLVWASFLLFFGGILCAIVGSWSDHDWLNTAGLSLEAVSTLLVTPELLFSLRVLNPARSHHATRWMLYIGIVLFIVGLSFEYASTFTGIAPSLQGTRVNRVGLGFTFFSFFPLLALSIFDEDTLDLSYLYILVGSWLLRFLFLASGLIVLWISRGGSGTDTNPLWLFPFLMLCLNILQEIVYQVMQFESITSKIILLSFGVSLIYSGYFFQLASIFFDKYPW